MWLVLAMGPGNQPAVWVSTGKTVPFGFWLVQILEPLLVGGPNPYLYLSTRGFCRVLLDPLVPISGSIFQVFLFAVALRYPTVNCKISMLVLNCLCLMYCKPSSSEWRKIRSMPHPQADPQWKVYDVLSCIMSKIRSTGYPHWQLRKSTSYKRMSFEPLLHRQESESWCRHLILSQQNRKFPKGLLVKDVAIGG